MYLPKVQTGFGRFWDEERLPGRIDFSRVGKVCWAMLGLNACIGPLSIHLCSRNCSTVSVTEPIGE